MLDFRYRTVQEVTSRLNISPTTLEKWTTEFAEFLSKRVGQADEETDSGYTELDITRLSLIKQLMDTGSNQIQIRRRLEEDLNQMPSFETDTQLTTLDDASTTSLAYFSEAMVNMRQAQASVLNSQAANRELMGVVIQDNFNLKEENARLRERMLALERQIGQMRREGEAKQEAMRREFEAKLMEIREMVSSTPQNQTPSITILQSRAGCLGRLFGGKEAVQTLASHTKSPEPQTIKPSQRQSHPKPPLPPRPPE